MAVLPPVIALERRPGAPTWSTDLETWAALGHNPRPGWAPQAGRTPRSLFMRRFYGRPLDDPSMSPFRCDGYVAEGMLRDERGAAVPLVGLPPFLRALLVTDGTVTKALEAYFWEPVAVDTLEQRFEPTRAAVPWIGLAAGDQCLVRDARLRGVHSGRAFARALSLIRTEWIPEDFRRRLIDREIGIGALIRDSGLESYREVLDAGIERDADTGEAVFRTYRIIIGGHPVILITECFPLALFHGG